MDAKDEGIHGRKYVYLAEQYQLADRAAEEGIAKNGILVTIWLGYCESY